jgi:HPt (histidine-containing phosphotransfer) domain-containing protein
VNIDYLEELTDDNTALQKELIQLYFITLDKALPALEASLSPSMDEEWKRNVHELKGASLSIGIEDIAAACSEAHYTDKLGEKGKQDLLSDIQHLVSQLEPLVKHLR